MIDDDLLSEQIVAQLPSSYALKGSEELGVGWGYTTLNSTRRLDEFFYIFDYGSLLQDLLDIINEFDEFFVSKGIDFAGKSGGHRVPLRDRVPRLRIPSHALRRCFPSSL